jgi:hypothetical protein
LQGQWNVWHGKDVLVKQKYTEILIFDADIIKDDKCLDTSKIIPEQP